MTALIQAELLAIIADCEDNHPRSLQRALGPSEAGDPCERKLAFKMWDVPSSNRTRHNKWRSTVGTAIHSWLDTCFAADPDRWLCESRVNCGTWHDGEQEQTLSGKCDMFDLSRGAVIDFKTTTAAKLEDYIAGKIPDVYRTQVHLYGQGMVNAGHDVQTVALFFLPREGELTLSSSYYWEEDFDPQIAADALDRLTDIALRSSGGDFAAMKTANSFCARCDWLQYNGNPNAGGCPGEMKSYALDVNDPFAS